MNIDKLYENYINKVSISSSGKWCRSVKNKDDKYSHPEPYTKDEFVVKMNSDHIFDVEFTKKWGTI